MDPSGRVLGDDLQLRRARCMSLQMEIRPPAREDATAAYRAAAADADAEVGKKGCRLVRGQETGYQIYL